jgi:hypothetical protein
MKNTIFGFLILIVFGSCQTEPKDQRGRYTPMGDSQVLDTETGTVYLMGPTGIFMFETHIDGHVIKRTTKEREEITK